MSEPAPAVLYLMPVPLGESPDARAIAEDVRRLAQQLPLFIVENERTARRHLKAIAPERPLRSLEMRVLDEHTPPDRLGELLQRIRELGSAAILSEAGCPAVADPGAALVRLAHEAGLRVVPLVGPSSILLALMASGLPAQQFAFNGYLPVAPEQRRRRIAELERESRQTGRTQVFIEAPYRNMQLLQDLLATLAPDTELCLATELSLPAEAVGTRRVANWRGALPDLDRRPTVFLFSAAFPAPTPPPRRRRTRSRSASPAARGSSRGG